MLGGLFYLVNHLREKRLWVRPHTEVLQLKPNSHSRHLKLLICEEPNTGLRPRRPGWRPRRARAAKLGCWWSLDVRSLLCLHQGQTQGQLWEQGGACALWAGTCRHQAAHLAVTKQPPGPALSLGLLPREARRALTCLSGVLL